MGKKEEKFNDYDGFVEKFKPKKTTDDCYTPPEVYDVVLKHVRETYNIADDVPIVRPFYPGGDYENYDYPEGCVVVDNPPFSIFAKILDFYQVRGIKFFLFAPHLTGMSSTLPRDGVTFVCVGAPVIYTNGANVRTSFATNLSSEIAFITEAKLACQLKDEKLCRRVKKKVYPYNLFCIKRGGYIAGSCGVPFELRRNEIVTGRDLSPELRNATFGGCCLITDAKAHELRSIECIVERQKAAEIVSLQPSDLAILDELNRRAT